MKKILKVALLCLILISLTACGVKRELSEKELEKVLNDEKFVVNNLIDSMEDKNIKSVYAANNGVYQIQCYVFKTEKTAKDAFKGNVKTFESESKIKGSKKIKDNYELYTQKLSDTYNSVTRVGKNIIYASIKIEYKSDFNKILKKLTK